MARLSPADPLTDGGGRVGIGTTLSSPGGGGGGGGGILAPGPSSSNDPIAGQFSQIRGILGQPTGPALPSIGQGGPTGSFSAGPTSSDIFRQGINIIGSQGLNWSNLGDLLLGTGQGILQQPADFYSKLLSGDPTTMSQVLAPTAAEISQQYQPAFTEARQFLPRGGYGASTTAELPFTIAGQVGNAALGLQPAAAQALNQLGLDVSKLGLGEQAAGQADITAMIQGVLGKMGVTTPLSQSLSNIGSFISSLI